jgi:excisionase family DNA binding protein
VTRLLLTVPEAAEALAISRSKLYELIAAGLVRSVRIDGSRRVPVEALETYITTRLDQEEAIDVQASRRCDQTRHVMVLRDPGPGPSDRRE